MKVNGKRALLCSCENTMEIDAKAIASTFDQEAPFVFSQLCRSQQGEFMKALSGGEDLLIACGREAPLFEELRAEMGENAPSADYVDIREKAGWSKNAKKATAKISALLAEATLMPNIVESVPLSSKGTVLIYGNADIAFEAASLLKGRLSCVICLNNADDVLPPQQSDTPIFKGQAREAKGHLGAYEVTFNDFAPIEPSSKGGLSFTLSQNNITEEFDLILDLDKYAPLFPAHQKRDGYFAVDPNDKVGLFKAALELSDLIGDFTKPRYALVNEHVCAHSRNQITGCTKCLDACGSSAILSAGDSVEIDPYMCEGCGDCSAVCPSGAISYALPSADHTHRRMQKLLSTYSQAGGKNPILLAHDAELGEEALNVLGQVGSGLAANVIPFALQSVSIMDHGLMLSALAYGAEGVVILAPKSHYEAAATTHSEIALAKSLLDGFKQNSDRFLVIDDVNPDVIENELDQLKFAKIDQAMKGLANGTKRQRVRFVFDHLNSSSDGIIPLEKGMPYGQVLVDTDACSMCMSCVSACPTQALQANQDAPILSFVESSCIQCGICKNTCPEKAITLDPRLNITSLMLDPVVLKKDEPAVCPDCGKEFGSKSTVDTVLNKLSNMPNFNNPAQLEMLQKCEDCRVISIATQKEPFNFGERPKPRTTDDYLN